MYVNTPLRIKSSNYWPDTLKPLFRIRACAPAADMSNNGTSTKTTTKNVQKFSSNRTHYYYWQTRNYGHKPKVSKSQAWLM